MTEQRTTNVQMSRTIEFVSVCRECRVGGPSCLHVPVSVITMGDARCDWFKCNPIKLIKGQRER